MLFRISEWQPTHWRVLFFLHNWWCNLHRSTTLSPPLYVKRGFFVRLSALCMPPSSWMTQFMHNQFGFVREFFRFYLVRDFKFVLLKRLQIYWTAYLEDNHLGKKSHPIYTFLADIVGKKYVNKIILKLLGILQCTFE